MDLIVKFTLPGLAMAPVFYVAIMSCPWTKEILRVHWIVDIVCSSLMIAMTVGTFSGAMTGALGGIILTLLLWGTWHWFYEEVEWEEVHENSTS